MAKTWTVAPSEGVTNNNDGTFVFPSNDTYCSSSYTITYKDTDQGCTCSQIFTQVGKSCSNSSDDPIWDSYSCDGHEGSWITISGTQKIYPRHVENCTACIDDEPYTIIVYDDVWCEEPTPPCCSGFSVGNIDYCRDGTNGNLGNCGTLDCSSTSCCGNISSISASSSGSWLSDPEYTQDAEGDWHFRAICDSMSAGSGNRECTCTATVKCGAQTFSVSWTVTQYDVPCD